MGTTVSSGPSGRQRAGRRPSSPSPFSTRRPATRLEGSSRVLVKDDQLAAHDRLEAQVLRAIAETGVHGRTRTAVLDRLVYEALVAATRGADLVVVGPRARASCAEAVPRPPSRRLARGA